MTSAERCSVFEIPRCYDPNISECSQITLMGFCDASKKRFAAVIYLRVKFGDGDELRASTNLVVEKTRVAPLEKQTIPRMEFLDCLILARLMNRIRNILHGSLEVHQEYCMTDSAVALHWIQNVTKTYKQYVETRVAEIRSLVPADIWRHIPGSENAADLPSRGCIPEHLEKQKEQWFHGPGWMKDDVARWPIKLAKEVEIPEEVKMRLANEIKKSEVKQEVTCLTTEDINIEKVIDPTRYSSFTMLLRITALCWKFIEKCRQSKEKRMETYNMQRTVQKMKWSYRLKKLIGLERHG